MLGWRLRPWHGDAAAPTACDNQARVAPGSMSAVRCRDRIALDDLRQGLALRVIEQRRPAGRQHVDQTIRTGGVEPQDPIANRLQTNAAKLRRIAARATLINRRQDKQPTDLVGVSAMRCYPHGEEHNEGEGDLFVAPD